jgi:stearoyl-CoA desaturase (delta-9 desaturase)
MSLGEGWHNTHHAKPYLWNQGIKWWEFDPPSWIIRVIKK